MWICNLALLENEETIASNAEISENLRKPGGLWYIFDMGNEVL